MNMSIRLFGVMLFASVLFAGCVSDAEGKKYCFLSNCETAEEQRADFWLNHG